MATEAIPATPDTHFVPLAWRNLVANKRRLIRSSAGIGFAVLLMLVQLGFERGFFNASLGAIRQLDGDLFVMRLLAGFVLEGPV
jgi:putative ABC transport system permease protein